MTEFRIHSDIGTLDECPMMKHVIERCGIKLYEKEVYAGRTEYMVDADLDQLIELSIHYEFSMCWDPNTFAPPMLEVKHRYGELKEKEVLE